MERDRGDARAESQGDRYEERRGLSGVDWTIALWVRRFPVHYRPRSPSSSFPFRLHLACEARSQGTTNQEKTKYHYHIAAIPRLIFLSKVISIFHGPTPSDTALPRTCNIVGYDAFPHSCSVRRNRKSRQCPRAECKRRSREDVSARMSPQVGRDWWFVVMNDEGATGIPRRGAGAHIITTSGLRLRPAGKHRIAVLGSISDRNSWLGV